MELEQAKTEVKELRGKTSEIQNSNNASTCTP